MRVRVIHGDSVPLAAQRLRRRHTRRSRADHRHPTAGSARDLAQRIPSTEYCNSITNFSSLPIWIGVLHTPPPCVHEPSHSALAGRPGCKSPDRAGLAKHVCRLKKPPPRSSAAPSEYHCPAGRRAGTAPDRDTEYSVMLRSERSPRHKRSRFPRNESGAGRRPASATGWTGACARALRSISTTPNHGS